jgi:hypothetical protein
VLSLVAMIWKFSMHMMKMREKPSLRGGNTVGRTQLTHFIPSRIANTAKV